VEKRNIIFINYFFLNIVLKEIKYRFSSHFSMFLKDLGFIEKMPILENKKTGTPDSEGEGTTKRVSLIPRIWCELAHENAWFWVFTDSFQGAELTYLRILCASCTLKDKGLPLLNQGRGLFGFIFEHLPKDC
jgi:hypothetical protein